MELPPQKIAGRLKQPLLVKGRRKTAVDIALASAVERGPSRGVPDFLVTNGLPEIAEDECTGCGACVAVCPEDAISLITQEQREPAHA